MRAIQARQAGGPDVLELVDLPDPDPGPGEVAVAVAAAGVNFIDTYRRAGIYPVAYPHVVGSEGAGRVTALGEGVTDLAVGDRVAWADAPGSYASRVVVTADRALRVPDDVDDATAAALPSRASRRTTSPPRPTPCSPATTSSCTPAPAASVSCSRSSPWRAAAG
ncbi:hypothetical protein GCM10025875_16600 [Litorihabitans aurantiacus]|uniref:Enoyl reductase (ER) domain-containing protein n=1 Tax=Litorihabitans aurantiacus TaxID=1930061 RepID=A0AA37XED2_9MICO|nr:hypothetical protein GCM10025875_16600 [Litorihabitans aurantiacus]